ncbi:MFS general substrate transporter [Meredithblackwellia eburnea MCA 4105]
MQTILQRRAFATDPAILALALSPAEIGAATSSPSNNYDAIPQLSSSVEPRKRLLPSSSRSSFTLISPSFPVSSASSTFKLEKPLATSSLPAPGSGGVLVNGGDVEDPFLVTFEDGSPHNPQNWSLWKKWGVAALVTHIALLVGAASSINSGAAIKAGEVLGVSQEVIALDTGLFLIGFGVASPLLGPLSEISGRNPVYLATLAAFCLLEVGCALSKNIATRCILRFLAGCFGSTPLANIGGTLGDIFSAEQRTVVFPLYAAAAFLGPLIGPVIGGFIGESNKVGFEFCDWVSAMWGAVGLISSALFLPETFAPVLLKMKARELRKVTNDSRYQTVLERLRETVPFKAHFKEAIMRPYLLAIQEPIVLLFSLYLSVVYIILFGDFVAYPIIFGNTFGLSMSQVGICFLAITIGLGIVTLLIPVLVHFYRKEQRRVEEEGKGETVQPEERLRIAVIGTWFVPVGMLWMAWTVYSKLTVWPALASQVFVGIGVLACFISSYHGAAVMFTGPLFEKLGDHWALTFLALLSLLISFVPLIFYFKGATIRSWSRYAPKVNA